VTQKGQLFHQPNSDQKSIPFQSHARWEDWAESKKVEKGRELTRYFFRKQKGKERWALSAAVPCHGLGQRGPVKGKPGQEHKVNGANFLNNRRNA